MAKTSLIKLEETTNIVCFFLRQNWIAGEIDCFLGSSWEDLVSGFPRGQSLG